MVFQFGVPLFAGVGVANILFSIDRWMLLLLSSSKAVGLFTAATLVAQMPISFLAGGIGPSANAMAVRALEFTDDETVKAQRGRTGHPSRIVLPAALASTALSRNLADVIVGELRPERHQPALAIRRIGDMDYSRLLLRQRLPSCSHATAGHFRVVTLAANIALDFWLIPWKGELGAAIGSCAALSVGFVVAVIASRKVYKLPLQ